MLPKDIFPVHFMKIDLEMAEKISNKTRIKYDNDKKKEEKETSE